MHVPVELDSATKVLPAVVDLCNSMFGPLSSTSSALFKAKRLFSTTVSLPKTRYSNAIEGSKQIPTPREKKDKRTASIVVFGIFEISRQRDKIGSVEGLVIVPAYMIVWQSTHP